MRAPSHYSASWRWHYNATVPTACIFTSHGFSFLLGRMMRCRHSESHGHHRASEAPWARSARGAGLARWLGMGKQQSDFQDDE